MRISDFLSLRTLIYFLPVLDHQIHYNWFRSSYFVIGKGFYFKRPLPGQLREKLKASFEGIIPGGETLLQGALPAISLTHHTALNTAFSNDVEGALAAAQQVIGYGRRGDVLLGISSSGNAKNVILAAQTAKVLGLVTLGMTGESGGRLKGVCSHTITVPGKTPADVQELHLPVYHTLCAMLEEKFFSEI